MSPIRLFALFLLVACGQEAQQVAIPPKVRASAGAPTLAEVPAPHAHMLLHHDALTKARDAVVQGRLEEARGPLALLDEHEPPQDKLPRGWQPFVVAMEGAAAEGREAATLAELSRAVGDTAYQCGRCHRSMGVRPATSAPTTSEGAESEVHSLRHPLALDRMWSGVVSGDGELWQTGAVGFLEAPLTEVPAPAGTDRPEVVAGLGLRLESLGKAGLASVKPAIQAELLGEALHACGRCHALRGAEGGAAP